MNELKTGGGFSGSGGYPSVLSRIQSLLSHRFSAKEQISSKVSHIIALLFGRPYSPIVKDVIIPRLDYWHHRSGVSLDFFCIGFFGGLSVPFQKDYDDLDFTQAVKSFEERSKWRYSGETDLVLLNAIYDPKTRETTLDFSTVLVITLERAVEDKAIASIPLFLEQLIHWAKEYEGDNPAWDFSDSRGVQVTGETVKKVLLSFLPEKVNEGVTKALRFYTKDLSDS